MQTHEIGKTMTLSQLTFYVDRATDGSQFKSLRKTIKGRRWKRSKFEKTLTGDARHAFAQFKDMLPMIQILPVADEFPGEELACLLEYLLCRVGGSSVRVAFLNNPGFLAGEELCFAISNWEKYAGILFDAVAVIRWCFSLLTIADIRDLIAELQRATLTKDVA